MEVPASAARTPFFRLAWKPCLVPSVILVGPNGSRIILDFAESSAVLGFPLPLLSLSFPDVSSPNIRSLAAWYCASRSLNVFWICTPVEGEGDFELEEGLLRMRSGASNAAGGGSGTLVEDEVVESWISGIGAREFLY